MKKAYLFALLLTTSFLRAQSVDEILKNHFLAIGQEKLSALSSIVIHGRIIQLGVELPFVQYEMRPAKFRIEGTIEGISFIQTYNGTTGWTVDPFAATPGPQEAKGKQLKTMKLQADMDGVLWKYKEKQNAVSFEGKVSIEGVTCYQLKVITSDSMTIHYFIDSTSNFIIRKNTTITMAGKPAESDTYYSNFTNYNGIQLAGTIQNKINGILSDMITIDQIEFNVAIDPQLFEKPK